MSGGAPGRGNSEARLARGLIPRAPLPLVQLQGGSPVGHHPSKSPLLTRPGEGFAALVPSPSLHPRPYPNHQKNQLHLTLAPDPKWFNGA